MEKSICTYCFIPVRIEPREQSEMVTQILFGESFDVLEKIEKWAKIKMHIDDYEGWIDAKLVEKLPEKLVELWAKSSKWVVPAPYIKIVSEPDKTAHFISGGSQLFINSYDGNRFTIGSKEYFVTSNYKINKPSGSVTDIAHAYLNTPYLWGGRSFYGIDCSGFVQVVYAISGKKLPRDASQQVAIGQMVSFVEEARPGDLAFFDNEEGKIVHVGICLGAGKIIHASGRVRLDKLDHQGIFDVENRKYTHKLRVIKRLF